MSLTAAASTRTTNVGAEQYIRYWSLQLFNQDYDPVYLTNYVVCVNFIHEWRDLQFKVDSERQIFVKTFRGNLISLSELLPEIC